MTLDNPADQAAHTQRTREAYDQLAAVWSATTDEGPFNGLLERPALRSLIPGSLTGAVVLDAGCGSGAQAQWLLDQGAEVVGIDVSPRMIEEAERRCRGRGRFLVADLAKPLPLEPTSLDGITCSLALHYVADWSVPLRSFASALRPGGWAVISVDHPLGPPLPSQQGGYFDTELLTDTWEKGGVAVCQQFWRRPLSRPRRVRRRWLPRGPRCRTTALERGTAAVSGRSHRQRRSTGVHRLPAVAAALGTVAEPSSRCAASGVGTLQSCLPMRGQRLSCWAAGRPRWSLLRVWRPRWGWPPMPCG